MTLNLASNLRSTTDHSGFDLTGPAPVGLTVRPRDNDAMETAVFSNVEGWLPLSAPAKPTLDSTPWRQC